MHNCQLLNTSYCTHSYSIYITISIYIYMRNRHAYFLIYKQQELYLCVTFYVVFFFFSVYTQYVDCCEATKKFEPRCNKKRVFFNITYIYISFGSCINYYLYSNKIELNNFPVSTLHPRSIDAIRIVIITTNNHQNDNVIKYLSKSYFNL